MNNQKQKRTIEWAIERLEICQDQAFQSCECEECQQCGLMPDECTGTDCAQTCQCSTCDHCGNESAITELRALLDEPPTGWLPCSPNLLESGVDCAIAPRWSSKEWDGHSHWHPSPAPPHQGEPVAIEWPDYHSEGMGCGLEDRGITDRYEACRYGFEEAVERCAELFASEGGLYLHPAKQPVDAVVTNTSWMTDAELDAICQPGSGNKAKRRIEAINKARGEA